MRGKLPVVIACLTLMTLSFAALAAAATANADEAATAGAAAKPVPATTPPPTPSVVVRTINLVANDLVYDAQTHTILASVPSRVGRGGNSVVAIDPVSATVGTPFFVG